MSEGVGPATHRCSSCCPDTVNPGTEGADEVIIKAVLWGHRLLGVRIKDRSRPGDQ